jgi:hypothetical protein
LEQAESLKPRSQYADEAVQLAIEARWDDAVALNRQILDKFGPDEEATNRLGKALTELGRLDEAKDAYEQTLRINPLNQIARKNAAKLNTLLQAEERIGVGAVKVDLNLFVEEMGKTVVTSVESEDGELSARIAAGDVAELHEAGDGILIETVRGVRVGTLEPKLARRLLKFLQGGNRYQAGITAVEGRTARVIIRETYQDPRFAGKPSFPMRRPKREVEFRPYSKETVLGEISGFVPDEEEGEAGELGEPMEGMQVEEEEEEAGIDFAAEEDVGGEEEEEE